jgi:hypothetical protein
MKLIWYIGYIATTYILQIGTGQDVEGLIPSSVYFCHYNSSLRFLASPPRPPLTHLTTPTPTPTPTTLGHFVALNPNHNANTVTHSPNLNLGNNDRSNEDQDEDNCKCWEQATVAT